MNTRSRSPPDFFGAAISRRWPANNGPHVKHVHALNQLPGLACGLSDDGALPLLLFNSDHAA